MIYQQAGHTITAAVRIMPECRTVTERKEPTMKSLKKRLLGLTILSVLCTLLFSGCGKVEDGKISEPHSSDRGSIGSDMEEGMSHMESDARDMVSDAGDAVRDGVTKAEDAGRDVITDVSKAASEAAQDVRDAVR